MWHQPVKRSVKQAVAGQIRSTLQHALLQAWHGRHRQGVQQGFQARVLVTQRLCLMIGKPKGLCRHALIRWPALGPAAMDFDELRESFRCHVHG